RDHVITVGGVEGHRVGLAVGGTVGPEVDLDLFDVGSGEVVDGDVVGAAQRVDVERLHTMHVHGDVADVAEQPDTRAVGRDVDVLGNIGAVEKQRVVAGLPFDGVAAVARVPDEGII